MKIRTFEINREGQLMERKVEGQLEDMKHTLLEALYPGIQLARVQVPVEPLDSIGQALAEQALGNLKLEGVTYRLVGASGSAKDRTSTRRKHESVPTTSSSTSFLVRTRCASK